MMSERQLERAALPMLPIRQAATVDFGSCASINRYERVVAPETALLNQRFCLDTVALLNFAAHGTVRRSEELD